MEIQNLIFFFQKSLKLNLTCVLTCAEDLKSFKWVSTCTYMSTSGMHRRPFEGRHLVLNSFLNYWPKTGKYSTNNKVEFMLVRRGRHLCSSQ